MPVTTNVKLSQMQYVILYVKDTEKALPFYRDTLGMTVKMAHPGWVEFQTGATTLCLHGEDKEHPMPEKARPTIMCFTVDDIHGTYEALKSKGVKFESEPHMVCEEEGKKGMSANFTDADGNCLSIFGFVK